MRGYIEGWWGQKLTPDDRTIILQALGSLPYPCTYLHAPKHDAWHRARWRDPYPQSTQLELVDLVRKAQQYKVKVALGISPGVGWQGTPADMDALKRKVASLVSLAPQTICVLFDDVTVGNKLEQAGQSHAQAAAAIKTMLPQQCDLWLVPTHYCDQVAKTTPDQSLYLRGLLSKLPQSVRFVWCGDRVIPETLDATEVRRVTDTVSSNPIVLWDNLYATDYRPERLWYTAPVGREPHDIDRHVEGWLLNMSGRPRTDALMLAWANGMTGSDMEQAITKEGAPAGLHEMLIAVGAPLSNEAWKAHSTEQLRAWFDLTYRTLFSWAGDLAEEWYLPLHAMRRAMGDEMARRTRHNSK